MVKQSKINEIEAQKIAIKCLQFIASDMDHLGGFLATTGLGPENLRAAARDARFLGAILTYISEEEALLIQCAGAIGTSPQSIAMAYEAIVGVIEPDFP